MAPLWSHILADNPTLTKVGLLSTEATFICGVLINPEGGLNVLLTEFP